MVSTKVGGVPEVLPPHMIRLAQPSASSVASTLADAVLEASLLRRLPLETSIADTKAAYTQVSTNLW